MEDQKWVIIDYKTDYFKDPLQREQVLKGYKIQINLYAKALTELTGVPVKEKVIGLITLNEAISMA